MTFENLTDFPGPHSPTVSGGIPGTPSSDALRAQKSGGTGIPVRGRDAEGDAHHRKSLRAAKEFTEASCSTDPIRKTALFHRFTNTCLFLPLAIISGVAFWSLVSWLAVEAAALWIERVAG